MSAATFSLIKTREFSRNVGKVSFRNKGGIQRAFHCLFPLQLHLSRLQQALVEPAAVPSSSLGQCLRELFASIEEAYEGGQSIGDAERFFSLLEGSTELLPVSVLGASFQRTVELQ